MMIELAIFYHSSSCACLNPYSNGMMIEPRVHRRGAGKGVLILIHPYSNGMMIGQFIS